MSRRFYDEANFAQGIPCELGDAASHHIARVLRMRPGDALTVFNGRGGEWQARIEAVSKRSVTVMPESFVQADRMPSIGITVALPIIKGERMDYAIQKATEMGTAAFRLVQCERSDVRLDGDRLARKLLHWQQVAISACEQCGMNRVPEVCSPVPFTTLVGDPREELKLIAHPGDEALSRASLAEVSSLLLITGPEGGFSETEIQLAKEHGFQCFAFGERVLRAETAPPVLLGVLQQMAG